MSDVPVSQDMQSILDFANQTKVCYLATVDGAQPRVRGFLMWFADVNGFYFHTGSTKSVCRQLKAAPRAEVCFFVTGAHPREGKMLRVAGRIEFVNDDKMKARLLDERPFLREETKKIQGVEVAIFRLVNGEAYFWTMADNLPFRSAPSATFWMVCGR